MELVLEDMGIGDLDLDGLEDSRSNKNPTRIPPQQVSLLEKAIIQAKNSSSLGVVFESLKVMDGKKSQKKEKQGRPSNVQRIKVIGVQLVDLGKYPTIYVALSSAPK